MRIRSPKRYQLNKDALIASQHHPWIFRSHLSSAAQVFKTGDWLRLVDGANQARGFGLYDSEGLIGIRVFSREEEPISKDWFHRQVDNALAKRQNVRKYTDAFRAIHGENDGLPGIVIDVYGTTGVLQTYSASVDTIGRYVLHLVAHKLELKNTVWKVPQRRQSGKNERGYRVLRGTPPGKVKFREGKLEFTADLSQGQKSGTFLDLRGLRKWVSSQKLTNKRVLNLFSYTGMLGRAAEAAGAKEVWNVDISLGALEFAKKHQVENPKRHRFLKADIFEWLRELDREERFDLVIVDPPAMTSQKDQVPAALRAYRDLYSKAYQHLSSKGLLVGACCTSRISRTQFTETVEKTIGGRAKLIKTLPAEDDHHVGFPEGDYLKILIFENRS